MNYYGKWLDKVDVDGPVGEPKFEYCPNCGVDVRDEEDWWLSKDPSGAVAWCSHANEPYPVDRSCE